jgi:ribose transport system permease protein
MGNMFARSIQRYRGVIATLVLINIIFSFASEYYMTMYNIMNILDHSAISIILSVGMVFVLATGGIDLSIGSTLAFTGIVAAQLFKMQVFWPAALVLAVLVGMGIGFTNGWFITHYRLQPFIVTLAMLSIVRGAALILSKGSPIVGMPESFLQVFSGPRILGNGIFIALLVAAGAAFIIEKTAYGRYIRAIGGGEEAAYVCGIRTNRITISVYIIAGALATVSSFLFMAGMNAAEPIAGLTTEWMEAIAAPIIGGNSLDGGRAYILGAVIGVLILSCIRSGLNMMGVGQHYQQIAIGAVIICAVLIDSLRKDK